MTVIVEPSIVYKVCIECGRGEKHVSRRDAGRSLHGPISCSSRLYGDTSTRGRWTGSDIYNNRQNVLWSWYIRSVFTPFTFHVSILSRSRAHAPQFSLTYRIGGSVGRQTRQPSPSTRAWTEPNKRTEPDMNGRALRRYGTVGDGGGEWRGRKRSANFCHRFCPGFISLTGTGRATERRVLACGVRACLASKYQMRGVWQ